MSEKKASYFSMCSLHESYKTTYLSRAGIFHFNTYFCRFPLQLNFSMNLLSKTKKNELDFLSPSSLFLKKKMILFNEAD